MSKMVRQWEIQRISILFKEGDLGKKIEEEVNLCKQNDISKSCSNPITLFKFIQ